MQLRVWFATIITGVLLFTACGSSTTTPASDDAATAEQPTAQPVQENTAAATSDTTTAIITTTAAMTESQAMTDSMIMTESQAMTETAMAESTPAENAEAMVEDLPAWQTMALTNARTGESFMLADFAGKHVFVETMATWCPNCRQQLGNVKSAVARADGEKVVFVAISVETDLAAETLAAYADDNGFDWTFAVATPAMVQALAETFGQTIANPPATPHFILLPDGSHGDLVTGFESGDQLLVNLGQ